MSFELAIAEVLEKAANYVEAVELEKEAAVQAERDRLVSAIRTKVSATTGEDISEEVINKLAKTDPAVLSTIEKLAASNDTENLGSPSARRSSSAAADMTVNEQVKVAEERLVKFAIS